MKKVFKYILFLLCLIFGLFISIKLLELLDYECFYKKFFNIYCPGCGTTRMFKSLLDLNIYQAFRYNPVMFILFIIFIIYFIVNSIRYFMDMKLIKIHMKVIVIFIIILVIYWILRNIPGLEFLRPTEV